MLCCSNVPEPMWVFGALPRLYKTAVKRCPLGGNDCSLGRVVDFVPLLLETAVKRCPVGGNDCNLGQVVDFGGVRLEPMVFLVPIETGTSGESERRRYPEISFGHLQGKKPPCRRAMHGVGGG